MINRAKATVYISDISLLSNFSKNMKCTTTNYVSKQRKTKSGITLVTFMGGTIWGHHSDKGTKSTICISDFLHYSYITFGLKT